MKAAGICAAVAVLAVGVLYLNDYQKLQSAREVIADIDQERQAAGVQETTPVNGEVNQEAADEQQTEEERASASEENEQEVQETDTDQKKGKKTQLPEIQIRNKVVKVRQNRKKTVPRYLEKSILPIRYSEGIP